jgi:hypothetical protein
VHFQLRTHGALLNPLSLWRKAKGVYRLYNLPPSCTSAKKCVCKIAQLALKKKKEGGLRYKQIQNAERFGHVAT